MDVMEKFLFLNNENNKTKKENYSFKILKYPPLIEQSEKDLNMIVGIQFMNFKLNYLT